MTSNAMNTVTTDRMGAFSTGRMMVRSITIPTTKEHATVSMKAHQYAMPALIMLHAR